MPEVPLLALVLGDPAGIGPELAIKVCTAGAGESNKLISSSAIAMVVIGDRAHLELAASQARLPLLNQWLGIEQLANKPVNEIRKLLTSDAGPVLIETGALKQAVTRGRPSAEGGAASSAYINLAIDWALAGIVDGIVTLPISKTALHLASINEPGQTEIFARRTGTADYAMMLYSERLAVILVTIHQSLASAAGSLNTDDICRVARLADEMLTRVRGKRPRLAMLGLNPHAGETGLFGDEEVRIIAPAVARLRNEGLNIDGPLSPDAAFTPRARQRYDGHIVMYHDQGLIPFKMISAHDGVNVTLGLPIVRTSPDHGTAYDIAGLGIADPSSTLAAIKLAALLIEKRGKS